VPHAIRIESRRHPVAHRRRSGSRLLCRAIFVALLTFVAFGSSAPAAIRQAALSPMDQRVELILQEGKPPARGGKALTKEEFWRAQWRDEGAVFPGTR
jgi:hypothetical protein